MKKRILIRKLMPIYLFIMVGVVFAAHFGSQAVTTMVESASVEGRRIIVVDAGHGGIDGGATSCTGVLESSINLEIALRLNDLLRFMGYETVMVRTTDTSIHTQGNTIAAQKVSDLKERVSLVNNIENALLISIHQNTYPDGRYSGAQVFYADGQESKSLADRLQGDFRSILNSGSKRQSKPSTGIYLMQNIRKPGVLIECGFLSNPEEEARLREPEYQRKLCCVVVSGISLMFT
jgi:N-acetylmuramoyl-L-alanine amidase